MLHHQLQSKLYRTIYLYYIYTKLHILHVINFLHIRCACTYINIYEYIST